MNVQTLKIHSKHSMGHFHTKSMTTSSALSTLLLNKLFKTIKFRVFNTIILSFVQKIQVFQAYGPTNLKYCAAFGSFWRPKFGKGH